uniref:Glycosyl transferase family 1 domain-containing protein n=1 Tax=candidate division WOR-3 bacterium TaxID=2052148 RepID=A0A7C3J6V5_UNCW3
MNEGNQLNKENIKFICFFENPENNTQNRLISLASINKIKYLNSALIGVNFTTEIVSLSWTINSKGYYKGKLAKISDGTFLKTFNSFGSKTKVVRIFSYTFSLLQLFFYLLKNTKRNDKILVYHSIILSVPIIILKSIKKIKLILEVEEIYSDVWKERKLFTILEKKLIQSADSYIFSTHTLVDKINNIKPYIISYGELKHNKQKVEKYKDKIHLVFAGSFDPIIGVLESINVAKYLDKTYHLHIIGFGKQKETENVLNLINEVNRNSSCQVTYDGCLKGDDYIEFIQRCHIGLSTISKRKGFIDSVFPSKILSYLCNNLYVVSSDLKSVVESPFSHLIKFYNEDNPESIAKAIKEIKIDENYDKFLEEEIKKIDEKFKKDLLNLINQNDRF